LPDLIKYLEFLGRGVDVRYLDNNASVTVSANKLVKNFVFSEKQGVRLSDNGFDLVPGCIKEGEVTGFNGTELP
jgi:beta-mannosidase